MLRKLWFFFVGGCAHQYEQVAAYKREIRKEDYYGNSCNIDITEYHLRCKKCGKMKCYSFR